MLYSGFDFRHNSADDNHNKEEVCQSREFLSTQLLWARIYANEQSAREDCDKLEFLIFIRCTVDANLAQLDEDISTVVSMKFA